MNQKSLFLSRRSLSAVAALMGAAVALGGVPAQAQQSEIDILRQQLAEMQARLDKLEAGKVDVKAITPFINSGSKLPVTVSGLIQVRGDNFFGDDRVAATRQADTFRLRRGELRVTGALLRDKANTYDKLTGSAMFDIAKVGINNASPLQELVLAYNINKTLTSANSIDFGQFKLPFGYEGDVSTGALQMAERALFFRNGTDPFGGRAGDIRDTGVRLRGNFSQFAYDLGVFNGLGERQNQLALSDTKAFVGRFIFKPTAIQGLQLGVTAARGNQRNNTVTTTATPPVTTTNNRAERDLLNAFVVYKLNKITAQAEYFNSDFVNSTVGAGSRRDRDSYYAHLGYLFKGTQLNPVFEGVVRYDTLKIDNAPGVISNTTKESTIGFNYYLKGNNAKIQTNLVKVEGNAVAASTDRTELRTQLQVAF